MGTFGTRPGHEDKQWIANIEVPAFGILWLENMEITRVRREEFAMIHSPHRIMPGDSADARSEGPADFTLSTRAALDDDK